MCMYVAPAAPLFSVRGGGSGIRKWAVMSCTFPPMLPYYSIGIPCASDDSIVTSIVVIMLFAVITSVVTTLSLRCCTKCQWFHPINAHDAGAKITLGDAEAPAVQSLQTMAPAAHGAAP